MKFTLHLSMIPLEQYVPLAVAAEEAGFASIGLGDSICYPEHSDSRYPYTVEGSREFLEAVPFADPLLASAAMATATSRIRFMAEVLKLPVRHPVLVAKQVSTLAVLSRGRFSLGVGTSPWSDDYEVCGIPYEGRGSRFEEGIAIIRGLLGGRYFSFEGRHYRIPSIRLNPGVSDPVPLLIGGRSRANIDRAARLADGYVAIAENVEELSEALSVLRERQARYGERPGFEIHAGGSAVRSTEGLRRLEDLGVTHAAMRMAPPTGQHVPDIELAERIRTHPPLRGRGHCGRLT